MGERYPKRNPARLGTVTLATIATLRRNADREKFLVATDASRRDGLIRKLASGLHSAFGDIGVPATKVEAVADHGQAVLCSAAQAWGIAPEFPLPPEESVGIVVEGTEETPVKGDFIPAAMAGVCGIEDHFQLKSLAPGLDPEGAWKRLDRLDTALGDRMGYAFRRDIGYLTANPALAGCALEFCAYVMPIGLELTNAAEETMRDLRRMGCVFDQSGAVPANFAGLCRISMECGGSRSEEQCAAAFRRALEELDERELDARAELAGGDDKTWLLDAFSRDLAILKNAYAITSDEAVAELWTVRTGIETGFVRGVETAAAEAAIGIMPSMVFTLNFEKERRQALETVMDLLSEDEDTRYDAEDYLDSVRADYLRWLFRKAKIVE